LLTWFRAQRRKQLFYFFERWL